MVGPIITAIIIIVIVAGIVCAILAASPRDWKRHPEDSREEEL
jgi:hypothetical protein